MFLLKRFNSKLPCPCAILLFNRRQSRQSIDPTSGCARAQVQAIQPIGADTMKPTHLAALPPRQPDAAWSHVEPAPAAAKAEALTISQVADKFGLTPRALRFYESKGLLAPAREGRGRVYTQTDQRHLGLILKGRKLGFRIAEIGQMIADDAGHAVPQSLKMTREKCLEQIAHLEKQLQETTEALAELRRMHMALSQ